MIFALIALAGLCALLIFMWKMDTDFINDLRKETTVQDYELNVEDLFPPYVAEPGYFTSSELQQLKALLNTKLFNMEQQRLQCKAMARNFKLKGEPEVAGVYYKEAEKYTESIKKVGKLQSRIKHKIVARG